MPPFKHSCFKILLFSTTYIMTVPTVKSVINYVFLFFSFHIKITLRCQKWRCVYLSLIPLCIFNRQKSSSYSAVWKYFTILSPVTDLITTAALSLVLFSFSGKLIFSPFCYIPRTNLHSGVLQFIFIILPYFTFNCQVIFHQKLPCCKIV